MQKLSSLKEVRFFESVFSLDGVNPRASNSVYNLSRIWEINSSAGTGLPWPSALVNKDFDFTLPDLN